ncbi:hypothetical protein SLE2022_141280 [Rubroshorea leprosula]
MEFLSRVGDSFLYAIFDSLFEKLKEYLSDQLWDSKEEIHVHMESWKTLLPKIMAVLQHAEENQIANQFVQSSLDDLRDLAYDMEYILEEFVIDAKRSELIAESRPSKRQRNIFDVISNVFSGVTNIFSFNKAKPNQEIKSMVMDLSGRLQKIENGMCSLNLTNLALKLEDMSHKVAVRRLPESSLLEDKVWGRDRDKDAILQRLLEDGGSLEQDFVIPIVGMGGLGKTTLARLIYNDEKLKDRFDLKEWVCVSDEFDVAQITRTILEHVTDEKCEFVFSKLQEKLKEKLSGRKFFLVLDDVWNKEYGKWDVLKRPFMSGAPGSKIIVTTRNKDVGTMMRGDEGVYNLELLQDDACLPLFARHALGKENFDAHPNLQDVGEKLVKRCKRLPLALKTLCGVLRGKLRRDEWENVLNSDIWRSSEERSGILPALRLSYNHLPSHLKRCFAYCALFPHNYEFKEKELVLLWMAEGLLQQQSHGKKQMEEEIGHQYFHELLSRSLFQQSSTNKSRFVMHDLINDLAIDVAGEIYCNLEHSMDCNDLTCLWEEGIEIEQSLLPFNLKHLSLKSCRALESLPNAMMMRMDGSSSSNTSMLMSRLERLEICGCNSLKSFPRGKLPHSLKYLRIENCEGLESLPDVDGDYYNSDLHSEIRNLPCFYSSQGSCHQLPAFLKEFTVTDGGEWLESFPEKMLQHCTRLQSISIGNLVRLSISDSEVLESLPKELALYTPNLNSLEIRYCENFKSLPNTMYQLKSLQNLLMQDCPSIESIPDGGLSPNLKHLQLDSCKNLKCVPNSMCRLTSLDELSVHGEALTMDLQNLTSLRSLGIEQKLPLDIVLPSSLTSLAIWFEENLESIPGKLFQNLSSLDSLFIQGCPKLRSLPREAFTPSLSELHITNCPHLEQHFEEKGDYWTLTWSIPCIEINE